MIAFNAVTGSRTRTLTLAMSYTNHYIITARGEFLAHEQSLVARIRLALILLMQSPGFEPETNGWKPLMIPFHQDCLIAPHRVELCLLDPKSSVNSGIPEGCLSTRHT